MKQTEKKTFPLRLLMFPALVLVGALCGYLYYRFVGCVSGTCAITSSPYISTMYGGVMGLLAAFIVLPDRAEKGSDKQG